MRYFVKLSLTPDIILEVNKVILSFSFYSKVTVRKELRATFSK